MTDRISIEGGGTIVDEQRFPGRQGRFVFAYLLAARGRPVPREQLADALWDGAPPATWKEALSVLLSKLRALLNECGVDGSEALTSAFGCYQFVLPDGSWVDVVAAEEALSNAERDLAAGDAAQAALSAATAVGLARRTFLPGEDGLWIDERRSELRETLIRALECLAGSSRRSGRPEGSVRAAEELVALESFRERGYRLLMQAHSAAGNDAEALRTYERCRTLLADELGAYPSPETEAVYLEILRGSGAPPAVNDQPDKRPMPSPAPPGRSRRKLAALAAAALIAAGAVAAALAFTGGHDAPPEVLPTSLVRLDPETLEPTQVVQIGPRADLVVAAGGYVWVTHGVLRYTNRGATGKRGLRDAGDRTLTRVDPSMGEVRVVGGGIAPCGLAADPSGDVWVANCYASGADDNVVRIDAQTLDFEKRVPVPPAANFFRGMAYGGGSLWMTSQDRGVVQVNPDSGAPYVIRLDRQPADVAWSEGYGDLWLTNFDIGSVSRMHAGDVDATTIESVAVNPGPIVVHGAEVWVGDWDVPNLARLPAVGGGSPHRVTLRVAAHPAGITSVADGTNAIWATVPDDRALWRIDPKTNRTKRIPLDYYPWGVTVADDEIWVAVRAHDS